MKRFLVLICGTLCMTWWLSSCKTVKSQGVSAEAQRRFDYYYAEAVKSKLAGHYDDAFELYKHSLDINPNAGEASYQLGLYYAGINDSARCVSYLSRAMDREPDNIHYKEALALFYLRNRNHEQVVPVLEDMVRCNPSRSDVLGQLVGIYMGLGKSRDAISALNRLELLEGKNTTFSMEKFRLYRELGEEDKAFAELESLAKENPNDLSYRVLIGDQYLLAQKPEKALAVYEEVRQKEPKNQALRMSMLDYYEQTGQKDLYQELFDSLLYGNDTDESAREVLLGNYLVKQENARADSTVVLGVFDRLFQSVPETAGLLKLYSSYLYRKGMTLPFEAALERILKLEPDNEVALLQLTLSAYNTQDYARTTDYATRGLTYYPEQLLYYFYLGYSHYQLGEQDKALEVFRKGVKQIQPDTKKAVVADMYSIMGDLYYLNGLKDSAYVAYDSCLAYNPGNVGCLNNYAYYLSLDKKDLDKAEEMSHRTIVAEPSNKTYIDTYAWILFIKGKYAEAKLYMDRVLEGNIKEDEDVSGGVLEHAGDIYARYGDMEGALKYWKMALEKGEDVSDLLKKKIQLKKYLEE